MANKININGTPQIFNTALMYINGGDEAGTEIDGYIQSISYTTGTQTEHVQTINSDAAPLTTNPINSTPSANITFATGAFANFYKFLNNRFQKFTLSFIYYTTGDLNGAKQTFELKDCQLDAISGGVSTGSPNNTGTFGIKCTHITPL